MRGFRRGTFGDVRVVRERGEFEWIARVARAVERAGPLPREVVLGIGDDAALLRPRRGEDVVVSTDARVEDVHFRWRTDSAGRIGATAVVAALSDLAAMGARPLGLLLSLAVPPALEAARPDALIRSVVQTAARFECLLIGGNFSRARETSLSLTAVGAVARGRALRRDRARPGDRIFVTGVLGVAALARWCAEKGVPCRPHLPEARLTAGRALARLRGAGACIDVSDGLVADLRHVLEASEVGAVLAVEQLPQPAGFAARCRRAGIDPLRCMLAGGEDYELLFSFRSSSFSARRLARALGIRVTEIGVITRARGLRGLPAAFRGRGAVFGGWRHF